MMAAVIRAAASYTTTRGTTGYDGARASSLVLLAW
jgi:hypothetical protein